MTPDDILALRAVAEKATPGPWTYNVNPGAKLWGWILARWGREGDGAAVAAIALGTGIEEQNGTYIATLDPPTVLALLDRLAALEEVAGAARVLMDSPAGQRYGFLPLDNALDRLSSGAGGALPILHRADPAPDDVKEE